MLTLYHGNRLEELLERLAKLLRQPLHDVLAPEWIVVQNPGMQTWLSQGLAERHGIAANLHFPLPASFLWRMLAEQLPDVPQENRFSAPMLLWSCYQLLPQLLEQEGFEPPRAYLQEGDTQRKRYQLARQLASLFDQYLVYRPDWILSWEAGESNHWQANLWRALSQHLGGIHRARLREAFLQRAQAGQLQSQGLPQRIVLFGLTAMAPAYLEMLQWLAQVTDLHLFVCNPSLAYWGDIESERDLARLRSLWRRQGREDVSAYYEVGNPLLASLGRMGRDFHEQLQQLNPDQEQECFHVPEEQTLLQALQNDILQLRQRRAGQEEGSSFTADGSLLIHRCHHPLREVQVLHDALLALFQRLPELQPRQVVVMAPDIGRYAPYVEGVFDAAPEARRIPWSVADLQGSQSEPLLQAFLTLLALPDSRLTASEVLGLLELPAVARRFGLEGGALEQVRDWIVNSGIRWGLDGAHRAALDLPQQEGHSWRFGLRRLLLGHALPEQEALFQGIAPLPLQGSEAAAWLGGLLDLLETLQQWRARLAAPATALEWQQHSLQLLEAFFQPDEQERYRLQEVEAQLAALVQQSQEAGLEEPLAPLVVREHLSGELAAVTPSRRFLAGQVTFCNMVPMRSIPFRVVALLGMNDGEFPRSRRPATFDLMAQQPRLGDRSLRDDDRYLFLEALLSARDHLHISYIGRERRSNEPLPPSLVVSELLDAIQQGYGGEGSVLPQALVHDHPLQPFSPRNFQSEQASYADEWLQALRSPASMVSAPFISTSLSARPLETIAISDLLRLFRHPARYFLQQRLGVWLDQGGAEIADCEPFQLDGLQQYQLREQGLRWQLAQRPPAEALQQARARGELPDGALGDGVFEPLWQQAGQVAERWRALGALPLEPLELDLPIGRWRLQGRLDGLTSRGLVRFRLGKLQAEQRIELWLRHLLLNLLLADGAGRESHLLLCDGQLGLAPVADAQQLLQPWLEAFELGDRWPLPLPPRSAMAYAEALHKGKDPQQALAAARSEWDGGFNHRGECEDPYRRVVWRGRSPFEAEFADLAQQLLLPLLQQEQGS